MLLVHSMHRVHPVNIWLLGGHVFLLCSDVAADPRSLDSVSNTVGNCIVRFIFLAFMVYKFLLEKQTLEAEIFEICWE